MTPMFFPVILSSFVYSGCPYPARRFPVPVQLRAGLAFDDVLDFSLQSK